MERVRTVDFAKGIAIFCIVLLHAMFCQSLQTGDVVRSNAIVDLLYSGLFLFFIFAGYFYRPERSAKENITKRLIQLTLLSSVLLLLFPAILCAYYAILGLPVTFDDFINSLCLLIGGDNVFQPITTFMSDSCKVCGTYPGYYFVQAMIISCIIFYPTVRYAIRSWKTLAAGVLIMLCITAFLIGIIGLKLPFFAHLSPVGAAFMYVGAYIKKFELIDYIDTHHREKRYWLIFIAAAAVSVILLVLVPPGHTFDMGYFGKYSGLSVFPFFVTMISSCYVMMVLFSLVVRIPVISGTFCCFGRHTLAILLCHSFIIKLLSAPFYGLSVHGWYPVMPMGVSILFGVLAVIIPTIVLEGLPYLKKRDAGPSSVRSFICR